MNFKKRIAQLEETNKALDAAVGKRDKIIFRLSAVLVLETILLIVLLFL